MMVSSCSAYGCTYRHEKGSKIGLFRVPKEEHLRRLWLTAIRRKDWKPTISSRICGKHFLSGRPSRDEDDPDYVPSIFSFNQNKSRKQQQKNNKEKALLTEILQNLDTPSKNPTLRKLKPKPEIKNMPLLPVKAGERLIKPAPFIHFVGKHGNMKENDNVEKNKATEVSNNNKSFLMNKEIKPSVPQRVWLLNFIPANNDPDMPVKIASVSSVNENHLSPVPNSSKACDDNGPLCVESSVTIDDDSRLSAYSDESTLTAKSSIPDEDAMSLNAEPSTVANEDSEIYNVESSVVASSDSTVCNTEPSAVASKDSVVCNVDTEDCTSETMQNNTSGDIPTSTTNSTPGTSDYDYSNFMWSHHDTKEVLAIKLETMLAINMSLREKVKFYQNKCKLYENEINNLKKLNKKSLNITTQKNSMKCSKIKKEKIEMT